MYRITTVRFAVYLVDETTGNVVARTMDGAMKRMSNDGKWKILGVVSTRPGGQIVEPLSAFVNTPEADFLYKNGAPRFTIIDQDHGTRREWGEGIRSVRRQLI